MLRGIWEEGEDLLGRKEGEALWPQKYNESDLARIRSNIGIYDFEALYQQSPYLRSGSFFLREWLPVVESGPKGEQIAERVRFWDKAASAKGDYTAGVLMCRTYTDEFYVEHVARIQAPTGKRDDFMLETARFDLTRAGPQPTQWHQQDPGSAGETAPRRRTRCSGRAGSRPGSRR